MTLRTRLLLVLVGILAAGLVVSDFVTVTALRQYLIGQVDQQIQSVPFTAVAQVVERCAQQQVLYGSANCSVPVRSAGYLPSGDLAQLRAPGQGTASLWYGGNANAVLPPMPSTLPDVPFTTHVPGGTTYRAMADTLPDGSVLVVAVPLTGIDHDIGHLMIVEILVSALSLVGLGVVAWWLVRRGLRPLHQMAATAGAIAAGDLSRRVEHAGERTEVGQLGNALNTMLGEIEAAFAARSASEERLRRFLADASHELRTPLTSIRGYAEMFDRGARDRPEDLALVMRHIRAEADRMGVLVADLLLLARLDQQRPLAMEPVDLAAVVGEAVSAARAAHPERTVTATTTAVPPVLADPVRIRQVIDNLVANALAYSPAGTDVAVTTRAVDDAVEVAVADRGPGIAAEDRQRIFEPFQRLDPSRTRATGGMGLGLAIVAAIVRAHGGTVVVEERPGGGAVFRMRLRSVPVVDAGAGSPPSSFERERPRDLGAGGDHGAGGGHGAGGDHGGTREHGDLGGGTGAGGNGGTGGASEGDRRIGHVVGSS